MGKAARLRAWGDGKYAARIRDLPCAIGGVHCSTKIEAHHVRTVGAGGRVWHLVPLCLVHHREWHDIGRVTFALKYGVNLDALAAALWKWRDCTGDWMDMVEREMRAEAVA